ncbi:MAG: [Clostridia bacterium]|nr:[FeFe] hydrogenase H-cluster radical SAM maturase HydE [Clostridia bacterium]
MDETLFSIIDTLSTTHSLSIEQYEYLVTHRSDEGAKLLQVRAAAIRDAIYGKDVFVRGLIEFSNICKNDCYYCGIRKSNPNLSHYRLTEAQIMYCCKSGYDLGFRTFVLQSGEDGHFTDDVLCDLVRRIKTEYPDCAITLSVGERSYESYARLKEAGADRYLLRHETATKAHYEKLHPPEMSFDHRMQCLRDLRELGYAVGAGFMVGSPYQTPGDLARDFKFLEEFRPDMVGIGPFIPHRDTPFKDMEAGTLEDTLYYLSILRCMLPDVLLPATTALGTIHPLGREMGIQYGANVIMPNLSPVTVRKMYELYDGKICMDDEGAACSRCLDLRLEKIGHRIVVDRGDRKIQTEEVLL